MKLYGSGVTLSKILHEHIGDYRKTYKMPAEHFKVVYDILSCRTPFLGGHVEQCDHCGEEREVYNSCRNRHCPTCQVMTKERWLDARRREVLPVLYFHDVFTLPHELNPVILCNKKIMLNMLFKSVSETLLVFGKNELGGQIGFICILHTWDQQLNDHFHLHCLIPGGALSKDGKTWESVRHDYLFSADAMKIVFKAKFMEYFKQAYNENKLIFPGNTSKFGNRQGFNRLKEDLWLKDWVIYTKEPLKNPEHVLDYLGRYTHRVAISNNRIVSLEDGQVTFTYKNRDKQITDTITLNSTEFIRRFLLHVIPKRFVRIRTYGFMGNRDKESKLKKCRELLGLLSELPEKIDRSIHELMLELTGRDIAECRICGKGRWQKKREIPEKIGADPFEVIWPVECRRN